MALGLKLRNSCPRVAEKQALWLALGLAFGLRVLGDIHIKFILIKIKK
jgi:hypothetical protein